MSRIDVSCKTALKLSCLQACGNDIAEAEKLYNYIVDGTEIPDREPVVPTTIEKIKAGADEVLGWVGEHRDDLSQGLALVQSLRASFGPVSAPASTAADIPAIPKI